MQVETLEDVFFPSLNLKVWQVVIEDGRLIVDAAGAALPEQ